jgi:CBS domain-containing protein
MKVSDIMTRNIQTLSGDCAVAQALALLRERGISGLPVVDNHGKLVGMFTEKDVLRVILPSYVSQAGSFSYEDSPQTIKNKVARLETLKVIDIMRGAVVHVLPETSIFEVAHLMLTQNARRIPIVDREGRLEGIVGRADVLTALLKG